MTSEEFEKYEKQLREKIINVPRYSAELSERISNAIGGIGIVTAEAAVVVLEDYAEAIKKTKEYNQRMYEFIRRAQKAKVHVAAAGEDVSEVYKLAKIEVIDSENALRNMLGQ